MKPQIKISFVLILALYSFSVNYGQVNYTDIVPDRSINDLSFDVNDDSITDFVINIDWSNYGSIYHLDFYIVVTGAGQVALTNDSASMIMAGDIIDENINWSMVDTIPMLYIREYNVNQGNWNCEDASGFLGFRIMVDDKYHYSWVRINLGQINNIYTPAWHAADFGFELTPDSSIIAGDGIPLGATSVYARDKNYYSDLIDIGGSFTKAFDETLFSEYRAILAKADDSTAYDLDVMNQLPESRYYSIAIDSADASHVIKINISNVTLDKDGDSVKNVRDYRVHLLNVSITGNAIENILSTPSSVFYLRARPRATYPMGWDDGDKNNSDDIHVSFPHINNEQYLWEYRVFVAPLDTTTNFDLQTAISLNEEYYTNVLPSLNNIDTMLKANQLDVKGNIIKESVLYQIFVLSLADSNYARISALSLPSRRFILKTPNNFFAGQKTGNNVNYFGCDSLFSEDAIWKEGFNGSEETYIDMNRDGITDYTLFGHYSASPSASSSSWLIKGHRNNRVLVCSHLEHDNWIDVLRENDAISEDYNSSNELVTLVTESHSDFYGTYERTGHFPNGVLSHSTYYYYIGFCIMDGDKPQYAWLYLKGAEFIDYAFQELNSGVDESLSATKFTIYPNPAHDILYVKNTEQGITAGDSQVKIMNNQGIIISEFSLAGPAYQLDVSGYPSGLYFCLISEEGKEIETLKFIVY